MPDPNLANNTRTWEFSTPEIPTVEIENLYLPVVMRGRSGSNTGC